MTGEMTARLDGLVTPGGALLMDGVRVADERIVAVRAALESSGLPPVAMATVSLDGGAPPTGLQVQATRAGVAVRPLTVGEGSPSVEEVLAALAGDDSIHGVLVQSPLPPGLHEETVLRWVPADKDVGGVTATSLGRLVRGVPGLVGPTALAAMRLLDRYSVTIAKQRAVVVGRSPHVGTAVALLLGRRGIDATVTQVHSATVELIEICRRADILISAANRPRSIGVEHIKPGATVIDLGLRNTEHGPAGDVDVEAVESVAGMITAPGSIGPLTLACLVENTVAAARAQGAVRV